MNIIKTKSFELAIYAKGNTESPKLALVLPGKLDTKDYAHMRSHVDYLASKGFLALSFDPPGTWESPGDIQLYTMTNYLKAVDEITEYYGSKSTFIIGHSRGATIATIAGVRNPHIFAFAAVMSSFSKGGFQEEVDKEWKIKGFTTTRRDLPPGGGEKVKEFQIPYSFFEDQQKYDLTEDVTSSTKPKLFILGKSDDLIPPKTIKETFSLFAEPKELHELDSGHDYRLHPQLINQVNNFIGNFVDKLHNVL
jgi:pimeloyl-ACP methyl ester carboxylesterase